MSSLKGLIQAMNNNGKTEILVADVVKMSPITFQARSDKQLLITERSVIMPERVKKELSVGNSVYLLIAGNVIYCLDKKASDK